MPTLPLRVFQVIRSKLLIWNHCVKSHAMLELELNAVVDMDVALKTPALQLFEHVGRTVILPGSSG